MKPTFHRSHASSGGDWTPELGLLPRRDAAGGVPALFTGREVTWSYNTRVAIRAAVDALALAPGDEVLAPAYNCGSELDPLRHAGLKIRLYPVNRAAEVDPDAVAERIGPRTRAVYVTHYFGFLQPHLAALRDLCDRHGLYLMEDCALSLLSGRSPAEGRTGDVAFFCFYKFFPVIKGGALVVNRPLPGGVRLRHRAPSGAVGRAVVQNSIKRLLDPGTLQRLRRLRPGQGAAPSPGDAAPPPAGTLPNMPSHYYFAPALQGRRISALTWRALQGQDVALAIRRRRKNYVALAALLDGMRGVTLLKPDLPADDCPHILPILVPARDAVSRQLQNDRVAATPWWAGYNQHLNWEEAGDAVFLKDSLLALPIHQLLGPADLRHIADRLRDALAKR